MKIIKILVRQILQKLPNVLYGGIARITINTKFLFIVESEEVVVKYVMPRINPEKFDQVINRLKLGKLSKNPMSTISVQNLIARTKYAGKI